ncbi:MAG: hypothetical protein V4617_17155 [Gemmatimonadota bacterium]
MRAQPGPTAIVDRVRINPGRLIDFHAAAFPETLYVGQQSTYQLGVFLTPSARSRLPRNPEFIPPELRGLISYDLGSPRRVVPQSAPGYEALVLQRALFPVVSGTLPIPAPQLSYVLRQSSSYFSREERSLVSAESARLVVRALPSAGRPEGFTGAVGVLRTVARIDTANARVGDPLVLTVRVSGTGNVKLLPRPALEIPWAGAVAGSERVQIDSAGPLVRGAKEFDWILTPTEPGPATLAPITYHYFDPYKAKYDVALSLPIELVVREGSLATAEMGESAALLPLRASGPPSPAAGAMTRPLPLDSREGLLVVLTLVLLAPLPAMVMSTRWQRTRGGLAPAAASMTLEQLRTTSTSAGADAGDVARQTRRVFHSAIAARLGVAPQQLTSRRQVRRILRRRGVTAASTDCVITLLEDLDHQGFAAAAESAERANARDFVKRASDCYAMIDAEAVRGGSPFSSRFASGPGSGAGTLVLLVALAAAPIGLRAQESAASASASASAGALPDTPLGAANAAYNRRAFKDAQLRFSDLVARNPRDVDLLANWGTAAWSAGDTVNAVIAWQRAARLDPLAVDLQERLTLLPSGARGGVADIPMVPVPALQQAGVLLWVVGWLLAAWHAARKRKAGAQGGALMSDGVGAMLRGTIWVTLLCAVTAGGLAWWGHRELDASRLAVVSRPETMHVAPGTDADAMGGVATGDVVRRLESSGPWERVLHADGRKGWLPSLRLVALMDETHDSVEPGDAGAEIPMVPSVR